MRLRTRTFAFFLSIALLLGCVTPLAHAADGAFVEGVLTPTSATAGSSYPDSKVSAGSLIDRGGVSGWNDPETATFEFSTERCWHTEANAGENAWVQVDFGQPRTLSTLYLWNLSQNLGDAGGAFYHPNRDAKEIRISYSVDGSKWAQVGETHTVAQAVVGAEKANLVVELGQIEAQYVKILILSSYGEEYWGLGKLLFTGDISDIPVTMEKFSVEGYNYVDLDQTIQMDLRCEDNLGNLIPDEDVTFTVTSDNPEIASVTDDGVVTGVSKGRVTITATAEYDGKTLEASRTVYSGYITPKPQGDGEAPSEEQQDMIDNRNYGLMMHFGINTFNGVQWSDGTLPVSSYDPETIDADQWARVARNAGMTHIVLVSMHHDGFCMWDTKTTDYKCTNPESGNTTDVIKAMAEACEKYGIKLGLYYSLWNRHEVFENDQEHLAFMKEQFSELLGGEYGEICEIWLDGGWDKSPERWYLPELYDHIKTLQPDCQVGVNQTIGDESGLVNPSDYEKYDPIKYFPTDFKTWDGATIADYDEPKIFTYEGQNYYLPYEETVCVRNPFGGFSWFWHPGYNEGEIYPSEKIQESMEKLHSRGNIFLLNMGIDRTGHMVDTDIAAVYKAADMLGIAQGEAVGANQPLTEEDQNRMAALLADYEAIDPSLYTPASYQTLQDAVARVRQQMEDGTLKKGDLAALENQLEQAEAQLTLLSENDNLALGVQVTGEPGPWNNDKEFVVEHAVDGNSATLWGPAGGSEGTLLIDLGKETTFNRVRVEGRASDTVQRTRSYDIYAGNTPETLEPVREEVVCEAATMQIDFAPQTARYVQIRIHAKGGDLPAFAEMSVYYAGDKTNLQTLYDQYVPTVDDGYSSDSWETFQSALAKAKRILAMNGPSQELLDETAEQLTRAYEGLSYATGTTSYIITAKQTEGGKISPASRAVARGGKVTFTIKPDEGYAIADVLVDGKSVGAVSSYTFENVKARHTITAKFTRSSEPAKPVAGFTDVHDNDWFAEAVEYAVDQDLMNGVAADKFAPHSTTTRGMIAAILYRLSGSPAVESDDAVWWSDARAWAMGEGISDGSNMEGAITREQLAAMLYRNADAPKTEGKLDGFADAAAVSDWAADAMAWAVENGILNGSEGKLNPGSGATRAETAAMLMRFCELQK